ncbi:hypothetical protein BJ684DRAFT_16421 [Piptocephalis cylindrospora]|uniref:Uncharacterized protein n=1 Tax=Piptocephalis cylindrospora TaxID=1907219 RepID=A0A4P9Y4R9_9FUNG|nr:hypothetical protein BJ684DRAFT_16421 [Piptocephalis cylindrospora]|eukprot:RKP13151.1 hypothetical protein BJ684DRAFT_16421 [Piptocephalis cylindrospora]
MSSPVPEETEQVKEEKTSVQGKELATTASSGKKPEDNAGETKPVGGVDRQALLKIKRHIINVSFLSEQLERAQQEAKMAKQHITDCKNKAESLQLQLAATQISQEQQRARCVELEESLRDLRSQLQEKSMAGDAENAKLNARLASTSNLKDQLVVEVDQLRAKLKATMEGTDTIGALRRQLKSREAEVEHFRAQVTKWMSVAEEHQKESKRLERAMSIKNNEDEEEDGSLEHLNHALELKSLLEKEQEESKRARKELALQKEETRHAQEQLKVEKAEKEKWIVKSKGSTKEGAMKDLIQRLQQTEEQREEWERQCRQARQERQVLRDQIKSSSSTQAIPSLSEETIRLRLERNALRDQMVTLCVQLHQMKVQYGSSTSPPSSPGPQSSIVPVTSLDHPSQQDNELQMEEDQDMASLSALPSDEDMIPTPALPAPIDDTHEEGGKSMGSKAHSNPTNPRLVSPVQKRPRTISGSQDPPSTPDGLLLKKARTRKPRPPPSLRSDPQSPSKPHLGDTSSVKELPEAFSIVLPRLEKALETDRSILVEELPRFHGCFEQPENIQAFSNAIHDLWTSFRTAGTLGDISSTPGTLTHILFDASLGLSRLSLPSYLPRRERNALILLWSFHSYYPEAGLVDVVLQWMGPLIVKALQGGYPTPSSPIASASRTARTFGALCRAGNLLQRFRVLVHDLFVLHTEEGKWALLLVMDNLARSWPGALKASETPIDQEDRLPGLVDVYESLLADIVTQAVEEGSKKEVEVAKRVYWIFMNGCGWRPPQEAAYMDHLHVRFQEELDKLRSQEQTQQVINRMFECERALDLTTPLWQEAQRMLQEQGMGQDTEEQGIDH